MEKVDWLKKKRSEKKSGETKESDPADIFIE